MDKCSIIASGACLRNVKDPLVKVLMRCRL